MKEYVDKEALLNEIAIETLGEIRREQPVSDFFLNSKIVKKINSFPTADVQEVRHGKWQMKPLFNSHLDESDVAVMIRCSGCGMKLIAQKCGPFPNYCAHCGAKMDGGSDEQEERVHH